MTNGWKDAEDWPPITMDESGRCGTSETYPLMLEGNKEFVLAWVYQPSNGAQRWVGFNSHKKPVCYYVLPPVPDKFN